MQQFDAFANPDAQLRQRFPFIVCLQAQALADHTTQVVAPLIRRSVLPDAAGRIAPLVAIDEEQYIALVPRLTSVPTRMLKARVANLARHRNELLAAVDLVFYGF